MKLINKVLLSISILALVSIITSCSFNNKQINMDDNNEKLTLYDDSKKLSQEGDSYTSKTLSVNQNSNFEVSMKYSSFSGDYTIWILEQKEDGEITLNYDSKVNSGDFKTILVNPNKEIENIFEGSDEGNKTIKLSKGEYRLKIVGRKAKGELKLSNSGDKSIEIKSGH